MSVGEQQCSGTPDHASSSWPTDWNKFQRTVAELLNLAGYSVQPETLLGSKKVDVYVEHVEFGATRRIAVECKDYNRNLSRKELVTIDTD